MVSVLSQYAARAVPRYTSYPTAPHFRPDLGAETYAGWLERLDPTEPVSLYLHVPFCRQLCWYCGCNMKLATRAAPIARYCDSLIAELDLVAARLPGRFRISHLHFGGGTPTALEPSDLARVMATVRRRFDFAEDAEIALEGDPRTLSDEMIATVGRLGFTRASFGVQEFDPKVQAAINRIQPPDMVRRAVEGLRAAGVASVNFDLIYGLPHQTAASLLQTIAECVAMRPDRIALFGYAHVPWMAKKQRLIDEAALPGSTARIEQATAAAEALVAAGYEAIGLDHFALPADDLAVAAAAGRLRRNFQGYTTDQANALLGVGATSIGRTPFGYVQNIAETGAWARAVGEGRFPIGKGHAYRGDEPLRAHVIEELMCQGHIDLAAARARYGAPPDALADADAALADMARDGLIVVDGDRLTLTPAGKPLVRVVAAAFDTYLQQAAARHSVAV
ncbi:MAG: oxygen-independent coproporphyrinogen III oxidase [Alphaproteobacteria bacterium]|nr:oxygen-independent coproporphyrinogen III oxidase [Alphaproteobacteria bacterium]MCB9930547.1 oxygen-independent coproporphyrinogen III oxidase [Alphaproteobacteria bacterium]